MIAPRRKTLWVLLLAGLALAPAPSRAADPAAPAPAAEPAQDRKARLDGLFDQLAKAPDENAAEKIATQIGEIWSQSGSDTIDLLMARGHGALSAERIEEAMAHFSRVIAFAPDYPEGWNARATAAFLAGDLGRSLTDVGRVLELEPRHYDALSGLGAIFEKLERPAEALAAYREALKVHPWLPAAKEAAKRLAPKVEGRGA